MMQVAAPLAFVSTTVAATALGFANIVVSGTVMFSVPPGANLVVMVAESSPIRWRDDGTNPSVSSGVLIMPTQPAFEYAAIRARSSLSAQQRLPCSQPRSTGSKEARTVLLAALLVLVILGTVAFAALAPPPPRWPPSPDRRDRDLRRRG